MKTAQKKWLRLRGYQRLAEVITGSNSSTVLNKLEINNSTPLDSLYTRFAYSSSPGNPA
ncbi:hypothetical protein METHB2_490028 [Candidatus Methylobacter favarea]|uniref:Uncharacterized protein n=1 Tax=Candidatus Methylobacter favarea TaxID=2707345 RepID=A0A8S0X293_9GAMM|nr:hypothetical protein METHB2_490028 [Candidatus Methylobacter favarea]